MMADKIRKPKNCFYDIADKDGVIKRVCKECAQLKDLDTEYVFTNKGKYKSRLCKLCYGNHMKKLRNNIRSKNKKKKTVEALDEVKYAKSKLITKNTNIETELTDSGLINDIANLKLYINNQLEEMNNKYDIVMNIQVLLHHIGIV